MHRFQFKKSHFIQATRPNTYPIAIGSVALGESLAYRALGGFTAADWLIAILTLGTALALQILSNLANDYGDGIKGVDSKRDSSSPQRLTGSGLVDKSTFRHWLVLWALVTIGLGVLLLERSLHISASFWAFLLLGGLSLLSAFAYSMGSRPYGYRALGELAVFVFFGLVAVMGSFYLQTHRAGSAGEWVLAVGAGILSACVLYLNNLRDVASDKATGKITLPILLARYRFVAYLLGCVLAVACYGCYAYQQGKLWWAIVPTGLIAIHLHHIWHSRHDAVLIGSKLRQIVLFTLFINVFYAVNIALLA